MPRIRAPLGSLLREAVSVTPVLGEAADIAACRTHEHRQSLQNRQSLTDLNNRIADPSARLSPDEIDFINGQKPENCVGKVLGVNDLRDAAADLKDNRTRAFVEVVTGVTKAGTVALDGVAVHAPVKLAEDVAGQVAMNRILRQRESPVQLPDPQSVVANGEPYHFFREQGGKVYGAKFYKDNDGVHVQREIGGKDVQSFEDAPATQIAAAPKASSAPARKPVPAMGANLG